MSQTNPAFTLTEIRQYQLACIKQLQKLIDESKNMPRFIKSCQDEILWRKHLFNHPEEVQV